MTLKRKFLVMYVVIGIFVLLIMGVWTFLIFKEKQLEKIQNNIFQQMGLVDYSLSSFFNEVEYDIDELSANTLIRSRDDGNFTNFLHADVNTFEYHFGELEQSIIDILNGFRLTHPYVNSVYMGRENGSFVRSHPRGQPTQYDPRDRPWYILAKANPGKVMRTEAYKSLTTTDINIGFVKALTDEGENVYGVLGADITLSDLSELITKFNVGYEGQLLLIDGQGIILAGENESILFTSSKDLLGEHYQELMDNDQGSFTLQESYLFFYTSPELGWKIVTLIPVSQINNDVTKFALNPPLLSLFLTIFLFGFITLLEINIHVTKPLRELSQTAWKIAKSGKLNQKVKVGSKDEIGKLANAFDQMIKSRQKVEFALNQERDLARALEKAAVVLTSSLNLDQVLDNILEQVSNVIPNDSSNIMFIHGKVANISRWRGYDKYGQETVIPNTVFKISDSKTLAYMYKNKKPILIPDTKAFLDWFIVKGEEWLRSYAGAPIIIRNKVIGFLNVDSETANFFKENHFEALNAFAGQVAIAIENAQLHEQIRKHAIDLEDRISLATDEFRQRARKLGTLYEIGKEITSTLELDNMLQIIADDAVKIVNANKSLILLADIDKNQLISVFGNGYSQEELDKQSFEEFRNGINGWVLKNKTPTLSVDIKKDKRNKGIALIKARQSKDKSVAIAPLEIADEVIGTLVVVNHQDQKVFSSEDLNMITMLASQAAVAIGNANLYSMTQEANRLKSAFLATMSHELRTPLNSIIGFTGIMLNELVGSLNEEQKKQLGMVQSSAHHLLDLINDVLDISKIEAGQLEVRCEKFNIRGSIEEIIKTIKPLADKKNLPLMVSISPEVDQIVSDQRRVEQILINLINNAIKFTDQGEIRVDCKCKDEWLEISVIDSGIGIKENDVKGLFEPFHQIETGLNRPYEGTGLGLSICKRLLDKLGGKIWVNSKWKSGSTFTFILPLEKKEVENGSKGISN